jgi:oxygen-independent coproporphyrinogen-3 oxidase
LGVASFGHISGVHMQNLDTFGPYCDSLNRNELPLGRGLRPTEEERLIREFVLQLKLGAVRPAYFEGKYGVDVLERFRAPLQVLASERLLTATRELVALTREGLLRVDSLLPTFFLPAHANLRYT